MGPTWVLSVPGGPRVGPIDLAIKDVNDDFHRTTHGTSKHIISTDSYKEKPCQQYNFIGGDYHAVDVFYLKQLYVWSQVKAPRRTTSDFSQHQLITC